MVQRKGKYKLYDLIFPDKKVSVVYAEENPLQQLTDWAEGLDRLDDHPLAKEILDNSDKVIVNEVRSGLSRHNAQIVREFRLGVWRALGYTIVVRNLKKESKSTTTTTAAAAQGTTAKTTVTTAATTQNGKKRPILTLKK